MGSLSLSKQVGWSIAILLLCQNAYAQSGDFDPEYDNETAAGKIDAAVKGGDTADTSGFSADKSTSPKAGSAAPRSEGETAMSDKSSGNNVAASEPANSAASQNNAGAASQNVSGADPETGVSDEDGELTLKAETPWLWGGSRHLSTVTGSTGLLNMMEAGSDEKGTFGLSIHAAFFKDRDYLYFGDENTYMWTGVNLRVTPLRFLEIFGGVEAQANRNEASDPALIQSLGDFNLGLKGYYGLFDDLLTVGLTTGLEFMSPVGEVKVNFNGMTFPLGALLSADFGKLNPKTPIRAHLNMIYRFDNSAKLVKDLEAGRGGCGTDVNQDGRPDYDGCLDPVERKALEVDRLDQFRIAIGLDAAMPYVTPLVEYNIDIPVNRQGFQCPVHVSYGTPDSCMDREGILGMRQTLTLGVRILPPIKTLSVDFGVDIGLTGYAPTVHEVAPESPYRVILGLAYSFDPFPPKPKPVAAPCPPVPVVEPIYPMPVIAGFVHDAANPSVSIPGALVTYVGQEMNPQVSDKEGRFRSYPMPIGKVTMSVHAEKYEDALFEVDIPDPALTAKAEGDKALTGEGEAVPEVVLVDCPLIARKIAVPMVVHVFGAGAPLAGASVKATGPSPLTGVTDANGELRLTGEPGSYTVIVTKDGYFDKERLVMLMEGQEAMDLKFELTETPKVSAVEVNKERINIKKRVQFKNNSTEIQAVSFKLLDEVANVIRKHPEIKKVEIQGHTDNVGKNAENLSLSSGRAEAVMKYLVGEGIAADRLSAKGYGSAKPLAPNITSEGRAQNRRVEFHILERAE
jgi:outer membrane protein OmpA-like peptidoglycan-associated protein